ncbi:unnamed protein product [Dicrocoelium dendriticum]|nr:unnamed protein product [Dicrocoelium dendriticum]
MLAARILRKAANVLSSNVVSAHFTSTRAGITWEFYCEYNRSVWQRAVKLTATALRVSGGGGGGGRGGGGGGGGGNSHNKFSVCEK